MPEAILIGGLEMALTSIGIKLQFRLSRLSPIPAGGTAPRRASTLARNPPNQSPR